MLTCSSCGSRTAQGEQFCSACGEFLDWSSETAPVSTPADDPARQPPAEPGEPPAEPGEPPAEPGEPPAEPGEPPADEPAPTPQEAPGPPPAAPVAVRRALRALEHCRSLAVGHGREDLAAHLDSTRERVAAHTLPVAVVGEFKRGKSTLVNALLQAAVCPVDADIVTAVPTLVRYGDPPGATAHLEPEPGAEADALAVEEVEPARLADYVMETRRAGAPRLRSVEVRLRHRLLRPGLCLVDTPGVGGLDSAHGVITLKALDLAKGVLFVTDASQELTGPEIEFLRLALDRCPTGACVVTKTDLYPEWRRIVELDEGHLRDAGIDIPVVPVSSFLRLRGTREPALAEESGFRPLLELLAREVVARGAAEVARAAVQDVRFVTSELAGEVDVERTVLEQPENAEAVEARLVQAEGRAVRLASATAGWQQVLADGIQDLVADVEHDLSQRLRTVAREVEVILDQGDPKETWPTVEVWLRRQVVAAAVGNYDLLARRAEDLVAEVALRFELEAEVRTELGLSTPTEALGGIALSPVGVLDGQPGRLGSWLLAARSTTVLPMMLFGVASQLPALTLVLAPVSVVLTTVLGRKVIRDERERQVAYRRQQAKAAVRRYLDEVAFLVGKDCRDSLRRTQRRLRDEFQLRAAAIHRSSVSALTTVQSAQGLDDDRRSARVAQLDRERAELRRLGRVLVSADAEPVRESA